jgi:hypothetical protein
MTIRTKWHKVREIIHPDGTWEEGRLCLDGVKSVQRVPTSTVTSESLKALVGVGDTIPQFFVDERLGGKGD